MKKLLLACLLLSFFANFYVNTGWVIKKQFKNAAFTTGLMATTMCCVILSSSLALARTEEVLPQASLRDDGYSFTLYLYAGISGVPFITGLGEICYYAFKNKFCEGEGVEIIYDEEIVLEESV